MSVCKADSPSGPFTRGWVEVWGRVSNTGDPQVVATPVQQLNTLVFFNEIRSLSVSPTNDSIENGMSLKLLFLNLLQWLFYLDLQ